MGVVGHRGRRLAGGLAVPARRAVVLVAGDNAGKGTYRALIARADDRFDA
jgi:hypothetical protein